MFFHYTLIIDPFVLNHREKNTNFKEKKIYMHIIKCHENDSFDISYVINIIKYNNYT